MNLGSRIEGLCKFYGAQIIISEYTHALLSDAQKSEFQFRKLDLVKVKGREKPLTVFEVIHPHHRLAADTDALQAFKTGFDLYLEQKFTGAIDLLTPFCEKYADDIPLKRLLDNCKHYLVERPPEGWDGVTEYKTK